MRLRTSLFAAGLVCLSFASGSALHAQQPAPRQTTVVNPALALAALDRRIADLDIEEQSSRRELTTLAQEVGAAHTRVISHGKTFYKLTRAGMLPVGGGFGQLVSHAMRVERSRRGLVNDIAIEKKLRGRAVELARSLERTAKDRVTLATQRTAMDSARLAMEDEQRRQSAFDRAFESSGGATDYVAVYGASGASPDAMQHAGFGAARGRLLFPVVGRAEVKNARREGTDGPGLEIRAPLGTPVRAVFGGRVAFADRYGPYGRIIIVDHGDHFYTVSGNLATIEARTGAEVAAGERIGSLGDEGQGPMLYFEVRHGSQTVPPGPWLGL